MKEEKRRRRPRKYTGVLQFFHNFQHDPKGLRHCSSKGKHPYTIVHRNRKHLISAPVARGHGRGGKSQLFSFTKRRGKFYDMASGKRIETPRG